MGFKYEPMCATGTSNDDYECKGRKSKPKPRKKRPTISKVLKSRYGLKSPEENDNTKPNLEEEKIKRINEPNKPRIRKAKIEIYEPNQESIEKNLEEDKIEDQEIGAKRKEILDQQKSTDMDLNGERNKLYKKENPIILARENRTISVDTACKNTIETSSNLEGKLFGSAEKIDLKPLLQKTMDEINTEKDIPKELIESVKAELNRANTIELDSTITKVNNIGYTCEAWKRKIETLKRITKKSKDKDLNKTKIQEDYESTTLDHKCEVWIKRVNELW
ncbi:hypothetical protein C2G38_2048332 [Gigaspora rosea]|uniref:Uncharacterized protein n=1 Tax=Gigaspora rosea TaxID=44941 RepID=A0A397U2S6_9GLOM|nr:hypothetical protein C2G38_2048332 [Gigaspora rosea]